MDMRPIRVAHRFRFILGLAILLLSLIPVAFLTVSYVSVQDDVQILSYRVEEELRSNDSFFMTFNVSNTGTVSHSPVILVQVVSDSQTYHWDVPYFPDLKPGETRSEMWRIQIPSSVLLSPYEISLGVHLEPFLDREKTEMVTFTVISFLAGFALILTSLKRAK
jgi:hypothetical protein